MNAVRHHSDKFMPLKVGGIDNEPLSQRNSKLRAQRFFTIADLGAVGITRLKNKFSVFPKSCRTHSRQRQNEKQTTMESANDRRIQTAILLLPGATSERGVRGR